jgi:hypothetical protein
MITAIPTINNMTRAAGPSPMPTRTNTGDISTTAKIVSRTFMATSLFTLRN